MCLCSVTNELPWGAEGGSVWLSGQRFALSWEGWIKSPRFRAEASRGWFLVWGNVRQSCCSLPCLPPPGAGKTFVECKAAALHGECITGVCSSVSFQSPGGMICVFLSSLCFDKECWDLWRTVPKTHCLRQTTGYDHKLGQVHLSDIDSPLFPQLLLLKSWPLSVFSFQAG